MIPNPESIDSLSTNLPSTQGNVGLGAHPEPNAQSLNAGSTFNTINRLKTESPDTYKVLVDGFQLNAFYSVKHSSDRLIKRMKEMRQKS